jgi:hypothetical protein
MKTTWLRPLRFSEKALVRKAWFTCSFISLLYYFAINVIVALQSFGLRNRLKLEMAKEFSNGEFAFHAIVTR